MAVVPQRLLLSDKTKNVIDRILPCVQDGVANYNLAVDGSVTPVNFYIRPVTHTYFFTDEIRYIVEGNMAGITSFADLDTDKFFQTTLTNGISFSSQIDGTIAAMFTLLDIVDLFTLPRMEPVQNFNGPLIKKGFIFRLKLNGLTALNQDKGDYIKVTVADDLTGFDNLQILAGGTEISFL